MLDLIARGAVIGGVATVLLDLWMVALWAFAGQAAPNWGPPGRWLYHLLTGGRMWHDNIGAAEPFAGEVALGWVLHYGVGIAFGVALALMVGPVWFVVPRFLPAFIWGMATIGFGWFLLQPALGLGTAAARTPNPSKVRVLNILGHTVFALGLWGGALALTRLWPFPLM